jgi:hypothetical protein
MAAADLPFRPSAASNGALLEFCKQTVTSNWANTSIRSRLEYIDKEFYRENMSTEHYAKARLAARQGKKIHISDICMPVLEPQVETGLSYLTSVFLTGNPIFGIAAQPAQMKEKKTLEAIISENATRGQWASEFIMGFRDGLKYNFFGMGIEWCTKTIYNPAQKINPGKQNTVNNRDILWKGNKIFRVDPYNALWDYRVPIHKQHELGEFVGYTQLFNRIGLKKFIEDLPYKINVTEAFQSGFAGGAGMDSNALYYVPNINDLANFSKERMQGVMNWDAWASNATNKDREFQYKGLYIVCVRYIRIIPREFGMPVPRNGEVQIWKVITVNDQVVIYVERMTNAHDMLPIVFGQPYNDGLWLQSKGLAEKLIPLQDFGSANWNYHLAVQRRKVSDRALYDPSRIRETDINSDNPAAKIPVRPSAYGKSVTDAFHAIPFEDRNGNSFVQDTQYVERFANSLSGQNQAQQGQFVKGNKTKQEYDDVQQHSSGRQRTGAIFIENQVMTPIKEMLKLNMLQYQPDGDVTNPQDGKVYNVNMAQLRELALTLQVSDGLTPTEKIIDGESWAVAMQTLASIPVLQQKFDIIGVYTYLMSIKGADLSPFALQPQQVAQNKAADLQEGAAEAQLEAAAQHAGPQNPKLLPPPLQGAKQ